MYSAFISQRPNTCRRRDAIRSGVVGARWGSSASDEKALFVRWRQSSEAIQANLKRLIEIKNG